MLLAAMGRSKTWYCLEANGLQKKQNGEEDSDSSSEDEDDNDSEDEAEDNEDPASELIRTSRKQAADDAKAERKAKKRAEKAELEKLARKRKKNEVNLNGLTSLSGRAAPAFNGACFNCGGPHHKKDCPQSSRRGYRGSDDVACFTCGGPHLKKDCPKENKRTYQGGDDGPSRKVIKTR